MSIKITQKFHLLLGFGENQIIFWDFKIQNSVWINERLDNGDSDNQGSTVLSNMAITTTVLLIALLEIIDLTPYIACG